MMQDNEKIEIARVMLRRSVANRSEARVSTLDEAGCVLAKWAYDNRGAEAENIEVRIVFEDGLHYVSELPIDRLSKRFSLEKYIRRQLTSLSGTKRTCYQGPPLYMPTLSYDGYAVDLDAGMLLDKYAL